MKKFSFALACVLAVSTPFTATAAEVGQETPDCQTNMPDGNTHLAPTTWQGKVILIDFWATWCPPCKKSMPFLNNLRNEKNREGFEIVAINVDENSEDAKQFLEKNPVDYIVSFDAEGDCPRTFNVQAMPSSYLIDKAGHIQLIHLGFRDGDEAIIRTQVERLLAE